MKPRIIGSDSEIAKCIYLQSKIEVWFDGDITEVGTIDSFNGETVKINDNYIVRKYCILKIVDMNFHLIK
ncbi:hypothetical protein [Paenibacillus sp. MMO-58]|uniref:hypothetical protein n=1 Tax=Paenibacillus sp. MMO-58 TaxID=3081290 RepID=UPI003015A7C2